MKNNKELAYLFGFSPWQGTQLENLFELINIQIEENNKISVVLIHDGVIGTSKKAKTPAILSKMIELPIKILAMIPDLKARGISPQDIQDKIRCIDYEDLVDILVQNTSIISWM